MQALVKACHMQNIHDLLMYVCQDERTVYSFVCRNELPQTSGGNVLQFIEIKNQRHGVRFQCFKLCLKFICGGGVQPAVQLQNNGIVVYTFSMFISGTSFLLTF